MRQHGFSKGSFYKWKAKYGGMSVSELKRMKELEEENRRLKQMYANLSLEHEVLDKQKACQFLFSGLLATVVRGCKDRKAAASLPHLAHGEKRRAILRSWAHCIPTPTLKWKTCKYNCGGRQAPCVKCNCSHNLILPLAGWH